ncbi:hypothetical protein RB601_002775 [Gaeumannomyces tritici]
MRREDCVGGVGGAIPWPPDAEPLGPGCPPDAGMRGLNFAIQMAAAVLVLGFFLARSYAKWAVSSACAGRKLMLIWEVPWTTLAHHYRDSCHAWDLAPETFKNYKLWLYASAVLYCPAVYLTKVTLLLLMARVFAVKEQIARGIYLFIVLITVLYTPVQVVKTILCVPIPAFWDGGVEPDFCFDSRKVFITDIALALCTDAVILILPVFLAWPLHLGTWKKVKIALLLGAGAGAIGTDALRISKVVELQYETDTSGRFTLLTVLTGMREIQNGGPCSTLELTTGFVCACVPPINLLLERYIRRTGFSGNTPRTPVQPWRLGAPIAAAPFPPADRARVGAGHQPHQGAAAGAGRDRRRLHHRHRARPAAAAGLAAGQGRDGARPDHGPAADQGRRQVAAAAAAAATTGRPAAAPGIGSGAWSAARSPGRRRRSARRTRGRGITPSRRRARSRRRAGASSSSSSSRSPRPRRRRRAARPASSAASPKRSRHRSSAPPRRPCLPRRSRRR